MGKFGSISLMMLLSNTDWMAMMNINTIIFPGFWGRVNEFF